MLLSKLARHRKKVVAVRLAEGVVVASASDVPIDSDSKVSGMHTRPVGGSSVRIGRRGVAALTRNVDLVAAGRRSGEEGVFVQRLGSSGRRGPSGSAALTVLLVALVVGVVDTGGSNAPSYASSKLVTWDSTLNSHLRSAMARLPTPTAP